MNRREMLLTTLGICLGAPVVQAVAAMPHVAVGCDITNAVEGSCIAVDFQNYTSMYTAITKEEFLAAARLAMRHIDALASSPKVIRNFEKDCVYIPFETVNKMKQYAPMG